MPRYKVLKKAIKIVTSDSQVLNVELEQRNGMWVGKIIKPQSNNITHLSINMSSPGCLRKERGRLIRFSDPFMI